MALILVPTPVGNREDITARALAVLASADVVACEDTRHTGLLLHHYGIKARLVSYHAHNERARTEEILRHLAEGRTVALVSDAGTPAISDPGQIVVEEALAAGFDVDVLPGPTAFVPALVLSGLPVHPFTFWGFLPSKASDRRRVLADLAHQSWTLLFYVSPHRLAADLADLVDLFGDRRAALVREISKIHQETLRGSLQTLLDESRTREIKGEMVLVVAGREAPSVDDGRWEAEGRALLAEGRSLRDVVNLIAEGYGIPKNRIKSALLQRRREEVGE
ncbi:16S rRNA (cytidine(1402)-2'-O)-methyltransferase [Aminithiophilus ramosus]|uniref:Ribosomal RNA small subunit methyltransferase I n=2 Tax=Synergistales TaxID=649776 RepID=A0A9Q7EWB9_9BACT|nr:16S rRNA (cytidine(1402)-2'-O)-methyltransferase [Aminithiophilus ramosus]QTX31540.1 16S rRNA (cytidine(1402)-2'-O)-methyltransferase [Aminithiophilus ramosus]QVL35347.1 16S rRNA (cytidine(1402)-2'-O)-methyltransferase [Synergistota bacterium]